MANWSSSRYKCGREDSDRIMFAFITGVYVVGVGVDVVVIVAGDV